MILTKEKQIELQKLAQPLSDFLQENCNPHALITIDYTTVNLLEGVAGNQLQLKEDRIAQANRKILA